MSRPPAKDLTDRELEVMHLFWNLRDATAAEARDRLAAAGLDRTYSTVANLVRILLEKGFLQQTTAERPFCYRAVRTYEQVSGRLLGDLLQRRLPRFAGATARPVGRRAETDGPGAVRLGNHPEGAGPMNDLGIALVWLTMQVTAVALAGLGLSALAARRTPGAGATAALTALAASVVLAGTACCPLPSWWACDVTPLPPVRASSPDVLTESNASASPEGLSQAPDSSPTGGLQLAALTSALHSLRRESVVAAPTSTFPQGWPTIVVAIAEIGTAFGLVRLLLGLWAVRRSVQRSRLVNDPDLLRLVEELRGVLRVKRPVAMRESDDLTTAATVGWQKPVLLLPADWRDWTEAQRRAVVAHELAHIGRGDFAAWLLARLSVALYFWHPLVRALAGRLQLQQELAADAVAAELSGGRRAYLRALAALALRADGRTHGWPAPAFLSPHNILLRRVHMLRLKDEGVRRSASRFGRRFTYALFFALTVTASALRGPVREALAVPPPVEAAKPKLEAVTPFDLTLVGGTDDQEVSGIYGFRPAALLKRPEAAPRSSSSTP